MAKHAKAEVAPEHFEESAIENETDFASGENSAEAEPEYIPDEDDDVDEFGVPVIKLTDTLSIKAPDKYQEGHVMTALQAEHFSQLERSRCLSNMLSMQKRNK